MKTGSGGYKRPVLWVFALMLFPVLGGHSRLNAQSTGACLDSASTRAQLYRDGYRDLATKATSAAAAERSRLGVPQLTSTQVKLVADTTICRAASVAFDGTLQTGYPDRQVIVIELGTKRAVIKDIGLGEYWLNLIFSQDFTTLFNKFGF